MPAASPKPDLALISAFQARQQGAGPAAHLLIDPSGLVASELLRSLGAHAEGQGSRVLAGSWRQGLVRPFGGLLALVEELAAAVLPGHPELLTRYGFALANLLPSWRRIEPLRKSRILSSGLARFALYGDTTGLKDYYWRRDETDLLTADLIHFMLDAARVLAEQSTAPTVLLLEALDSADVQTLKVLRLLGRQAREQPVLICATARHDPGERLEVDDGGPTAWRRVHLPQASPPEAVGQEVPECVRDLVEMASVLVRPLEISAAAAAGLFQAPTFVVQKQMLAERVLRRSGPERYVLASASQRDSIYRSLSPERRRELHRSALELEKEDPFAAAWHVLGGDLADVSYLLTALMAAWSVCDFEGAATLARLDLGTVDRDLLLALLCYEKGDHQGTERHLQAVVKREEIGSAKHNTLTQLAGYNLIFGCGEFDRGRKLLEAVLTTYVTEGREREALLLRNSIAYALFRVGRSDDAIEVEKAALELLANATRTGGLLFSVLQLNLGRLYRSLGFTEQALGLFRTALQERGQDLSPFVLILLYGSLAHLHASRDEPAEVLSCFHACFEVARDLDLENVGYPVMGLLSRTLGRDLGGRLTRGDEVLFHLYLNLARVSRQLGLEERSATYLAGMRSQWGDLGEDVWQAAEAILEKTETEPRANRPAAVRPRLEPLTEMLREVETTGGMDDAVASVLADGRGVAVMCSREVGMDVRVTDTLVLYDPRQGELGRQLASELGVASGHYPPASGQSPPAARSALALAEAADLCADRLAFTPLVFQDVTLKREYRSELAGLVPFHLRVQVLTEDFDGLLFEILRSFAARTGVALLAAIPFHLRRRPLAQTPDAAVFAFLVSSVDTLMLGDRLLEKSHGATSEKNLLPFRPSLAEQASVIEPGPGAESFRLRIRIATRTSELKLHRELLGLLRLCDGERTVAELVVGLEGQRDSPADLERQVCCFLRQLWHHGAIHLGEPSTVSPEMGQGRA